MEDEIRSNGIYFFKAAKFAALRQVDRGTVTFCGGQRCCEALLIKTSQQTHTNTWRLRCQSRADRHAAALRPVTL